MIAPASRGRPKKDAKELEDRKEIILSHACRAFARYGYANMDVEKLASDLGIGKGTIYRAFPSKQDLFFATLTRSLGQMSEFITREVESQNAQGVMQIQAGVRAFLKFFDLNCDVIELFIQDRAVFPDLESSAFRQHCLRNAERWRAFFATLIEQDLIRQLDPHWLGETLNQLLFGQLFLHRLNSDKSTLESRSQDILTLFFVGILTQKGLTSACPTFDPALVYTKEES